MTKEDLIELKDKISKLSNEDKKKRDLYLRGIATGKIQGPSTGYVSIDKPWLKFYKESDLELDLPRVSAYQYMMLNNAEYPEDIAINYFNHKINYKSFFKKIDEVAKALVASGVQKGDIVSICSITTPEVIYLFYALNKIGSVANMIDPRTNEERLIEIINTTNSKMVFSLDLINAKLKNIKDRLNTTDFVDINISNSMPLYLKLIVQSKTKGKAISFKPWNEFIKRSKEIEKVETLGYIENYPAGIVYTGGTTGVPKGAILSNDDFNAMAFQYKIANLGVERQQKLLDIMPPFIAYGLNNGIHLPLSLGVTNIIIPKFTPEKFPDYILKYKPNECLGVPSHFDVLTKSKKLANADLSFLIYPAVGGDAMNISLEKRLNKFLSEHNCKQKIAKGYGMTELSGAAITSSLEANKVGSVGIPFPKNNLGIFKPGTDEELGVNEVGEVCIVSPSMMYDYLNNESEALKVKKVHSDGQVWIHSQDYGYVDKEGFLYIKGRMKRTIVRPDGHNNYPLEIENVINTYDGVKASAVVEMQATRLGNGNIPIAFVVLEDNIKVDKNLLYEELSKYCQERLPMRDVACHYIFIDELPLTDIGKVDYKRLKEVIIEKLYTDLTSLNKVYNNYQRTLELK